MREFFSSLLTRVTALGDKSAWILIVPAVLALFAIDAPMIKTLIEWVVFAPVLAGITIILSRIVFPQVSLSELVRRAGDDGNKAAGFVAGCLMLFVGLVFLALVIWAKA